MTTRRAPLLLLLPALLLAACGSGGTPAPSTAPPDSPAPATPTAPASAPPPASAAPAAGCTGTSGGVPAGAGSVTSVDLDGDGAPDTLWIAGTDADRTVGVTTAAGATLTHPIDLAGPSAATAFALRPDPAGPGMVLVSDNRVADLLLVHDCALVDATDAQGAPWRFDQGFAGQGTGVGCLDLDGDGVTDLVGLNLVDDAHVRRTAIRVQGTVASAGTEDEVVLGPGDDAARETARALTCGDRTAAADGVHEPA